MPETSVPTTHGFDALLKAKQVRYLQALSIKFSEDLCAPPVSELRLAEERLKRYREDPSRGLSAFDVLDHLRHTFNAKRKARPYRPSLSIESTFERCESE